ncbi:hypothetical protein D3C80_2034800 [compost metagenome]
MVLLGVKRRASGVSEVWRQPVVHRGAWRGLTVKLRKFHAPLTQLLTQWGNVRRNVALGAWCVAQGVSLV